MDDFTVKRILHIDLNEYSYHVEEREMEFGGVALATKLLSENIKGDADPLSEDNVIVFAVGPFTPAYPFASKTVALFKSPLTGNLGESHAGGRSATAIANAGYDAIVIKGKSTKPVYLVIENEKVHFRDARVIWGIEDSLITGRIIAEKEKGRGIRTIMRIGGAGERLVRYAGVMTETYRHFGRTGLGAVFGSKLLKALVVIGRGTKTPKDAKAYREVYKKIFDLATTSDAMKKYYLIGTPVNISPLNEFKALPTRNLEAAYFEKADEISGEKFAEFNLGRRIACNHCPTACIHIAALRIPYEDEPYFRKTIMISYDYELIYALGSMLGIADREALLKLIYRVELYGLDAMSTGVCLAWATEALKRGLISEKESLIKLEFGDAENYIKAIDNLYLQPNEFYQNLAKGVEVAASIYGGREFALAFGGNEMPGYHTGAGGYIGYLIGLRHSHLDNAGYSLDQKLKEDLEPEKLVDKLVEEESWRQILSSLVVCFFARGVYTPEVVVEAFKPLGIEISEDELKEEGKRIYMEKLKLKKKLGFDFSQLRIPERIFEVETFKGKIDREYIEKALNYYKEKYYGAA
ncbi:MAG: aldehyde ferredoxin oxidoreductase family protein [Archaeoglobus sp.]|nr:aldehyde ferredoxin oxidoreductase family protein [Archaeoglobus sp.]